MSIQHALPVSKNYADGTSLHPTLNRSCSAHYPVINCTGLESHSSADVEISQAGLIGIYRSSKIILSNWFVYLIRTNSGALYTGVTRDIERRFEEHNSGGPKAAKALRGRGPLSLAFSCAMRSKSDALKLEAAIKRWPKSKKEQLVATGAAFLVDYQGISAPS